ncbi:MAG: NADH dehydrogenase subunit, partial [Candidatus Omnitrophica bacterium]|nr:NADH dehydrogenase subunit [Candidatus Omnitrophota bacterium]
ADMPIVVAAIDPCFSCTDRLVSIEDVENHSKNTLNWEKVHCDSIEWYRKRGIDFTKLNKTF